MDASALKGKGFRASDLRAVLASVGIDVDDPRPWRPTVRELAAAYGLDVTQLDDEQRRQRAAGDAAAALMAIIR